MAIDLKRFIARFVEEARDHLTRLEEGLEALDADPADAENINSIFRSAHTIKGSSRMLKLKAISDTAHYAEDVLGALRDGKLSYSGEVGRLLQRAVDVIASQVEKVSDGQTELGMDESLCQALAAVLSGESGTAEPATVESPAAETTPPPSPASSPATTATPPPVAEAQDTVALQGSGQQAELRFKSAGSVRIQLDKLDELIRLMGEVITSHSRLQQRMDELRGLMHGLPVEAQPPVRRYGRRLADDILNQQMLVDELHGKALHMRMLPLAMVFEPAARMVRELARSLDKEVECITSGMAIELDRQLIDRISDPVVHLLRNSIDHGIETRAARSAAGKSAHGTVHLTARQDGGFVVIEVADDGAGLSLAAIRDKALRKGLISEEQANSMPEQEVIELIFQPGFSTNAIITDLSGRGVGMDVVRRCVVDELQGAIAVDTRLGEGTRFTLRLPLSLAVMRILQVAIAGRHFAFTAQYVDHLLEVNKERVITVAERRAVVIDNEFVPVVELAELLGLDSARATGQDRWLLVVLRLNNSKLAVRIDGLVDERDMVLKSLPSHLQQMPLVSAMVVTGDNHLVSVLQVPSLFERAGRLRGDAPAREEGEVQSAPSGLHLLVVDDSLNTREIEKDVLEAHGYRVTLAEDGLDGLQKARLEAFDAVLTDVEMPRMDGFTLTATLRQEERYRHVPIVIITSREKEEDKRRGIQVGADAYIVKGDFDQSNLVDTLETLLG